MLKPAILALADGSVFEGVAIGASGETVGEIIFNTSMSGYQEIITDPSYASQIVNFTYPHIGNVGMNTQDNENAKPYLAGLIIKNLALEVSNYRAEMSLNDYLIKHHIVGIENIDTRYLTKLLRDKGVQNGCIMSGDINVDKAIALAKNAPSLKDKDLALACSTREMYTWQEPIWDIETNEPARPDASVNKKVVVIDYGIKYNMMRLLATAGCEVVVVPADMTAKKILDLNPDGIMLSNGPGDPAACYYAIENIKIFLEKDIPVLGICLGHQLLALACGAKTIKMKFGHRGANHPLLEIATQKVLITSQNHGFTVSDEDLPACLEVTHRSLFDKTIQGIRHKHKLAYGFQGHPEASPGPHDMNSVFKDFVTALSQQ